VLAAPAIDSISRPGLYELYSSKWHYRCTHGLPVYILDIGASR